MVGGIHAKLKTGGKRATSISWRESKAGQTWQNIDNREGRAHLADEI